MEPRFPESLLQIKDQLPLEILDTLTLYFIGDGALYFHRLPSQSQCRFELIVNTSQSATNSTLQTALADAGYSEWGTLHEQSEWLGGSYWKNPVRDTTLIVYEQNSLNQFILTPSIRDRTHPIVAVESVSFRCLSLEDIFLFKLIGNRNSDIERIATLVTHGLDYKVVRNELDRQFDHTEESLPQVNDALAKLTEAYGRSTPIDGWVRTRLLESSDPD